VWLSTYIEFYIYKEGCRDASYSTDFRSLAVSIPLCIPRGKKKIVTVIPNFLATYLFILFLAQIQFLYKYDTYRQEKKLPPYFYFSSSDWNWFFWPYRIFFTFILYPNYSCIPCSASNTKSLHALSKITNFASLKSKPRADQYTAREGGLPTYLCHVHVLVLHINAGALVQLCAIIGK